LFIADAPAGLDVFANHILSWKKFLGEALITMTTGSESNCPFP